MVDRISEERRSWNMSRIRSKDTKPELIVRCLLHKKGYRFRLHGRVSKRVYPSGVLPGKPDVVLAKYRTVIFVHGCFWHRHPECNNCSSPSTNKPFWEEKFSANVKRDDEYQKTLAETGWNVIVVWECETKVGSRNLLIEKLRQGIKL